MTIRVFFSLRYQQLLFCAVSLLSFVLFFSEKTLAQQAYQPDAQFIAPKKKTRPVPKKVEKEPLFQINGALVKAFQSKTPWDVVSPFAPASDGNGENVISENPDELGKENGITLFGVEW